MSVRLCKTHPVLAALCHLSPAKGTSEMKARCYSLPNSLLRLPLIGLALSLLSPMALATTYYVANTGNDANPGTNPAAPKQHIQAGINAAVSGDSVLLADGTYTGGGKRY